MSKHNYPAAKDCAAVWFARLEAAKESDDQQRLAKAILELRRLGYEVREVKS